ncbi:MAG: uroporphyrinogen-III synthase [Pseudomonadota bacterium]|nr:uroporphyrinogen-III synthase [Pseudomonadota bacterium]
MTVTADGAQVPKQARSEHQDLHGRRVVITRPSGTAAALVRRIRVLGGSPILLPGLTLRAVGDQHAAREAVLAALGDELIIFTSPAAVRHAAALAPLRTAATVFAVGQGTMRALRRRDIGSVRTPARQDSEGLLEQPELRDLRDCTVALIGATGGRGLLQAQLAARGARLREVHVYRRMAPRLDRRHLDRVQALPPSALVLLSSVEALDFLRQWAPPPAWARMTAATAVVSSERLAAAAREAGFQRIVRAASALSADLLQAALDAD